MTPECKTQKVHFSTTKSVIYTKFNKIDATEYIDLYIKYEGKKAIAIAESNGSKLDFKHSNESIKVEGVCVCGNNGQTLFK